MRDSTVLMPLVGVPLLAIWLMLEIIARMLGDNHLRGLDEEAEWTIRRRVGWLRLTWWLRRPKIVAACREGVERQKRSGESVRGYKWAFIAPLRDGWVFLPIGVPMKYAYKAEARAKCPGWADFMGDWRWCERVPGAAKGGHKCGFHAVEMAEHLGKVKDCYPSFRMSALASLVLLRVDLNGRVVPGQWGYRAERQQVLRAAFGRRCVPCLSGRSRRRRRAIGFAGTEQFVNGKSLILIAPACAKHADGRLNLAAVRGMLGTEVAWR